jgi:hypothetical protein
MELFSNIDFCRVYHPAFQVILKSAPLFPALPASEIIANPSFICISTLRNKRKVGGGAESFGRTKTCG